MTTRVFKRDGKVFTETKYNKEFVEFARSKQAKWNGEYWTFNEELENEVIAKVEEIYGSKIVSSIYDENNRFNAYHDIENGIEVTLKDFDKKMQKTLKEEDFRFAKREDKVYLYFDCLGVNNGDYIDYVGLEESEYTVDFEKEILEIKENARLTVFKKLYNR